MSIAERLFRPNGTPTITRPEDELLRMIRELDEPMSLALADLNHALQHDDVAAGVRGARRLVGIAGLLGDAAAGVEAGWRAGGRA